MIKEIPLSGFTSVPPDYDAPDGQLACALNIVNENGQAATAFPPAKKFTIGDGYNVIIHKANGYSHYIAYKALTNQTALRCLDEEGKTIGDAIRIPALVSGISVLGNVLICAADNGMHYVLWDASLQKYRYLGDRLPEISLAFSLDESEVLVELEHTIDNTTPPESNNIFAEDDVSKITDAVLGIVNKAIAEEVTAKGAFAYPFFVRYALRLFDGSLTLHSAPVLMRPVIGQNPIVFAKQPEKQDGFYDIKASVVKAVLTCALTTAPPALSDWSDIVTSVDIFVSAPLPTVDINGEVTRFQTLAQASHYSTSHLPYTIREGSVCNLPLRTHLISVELDAYSGVKSFLLPEPGADEYNTKVNSNSLFYLLKSIPLEELAELTPGEFAPLEVADDYLPSLVAREVMTDDYDSHDVLIPKNMFVYNSRLNITDLSKKLLPLCDLATNLQHITTDAVPDFAITPYIFIKTNGQNFVLKGSQVLVNKAWFKVPFLYYPNTGAYKILLVGKDATVVNPKETYFLELQLKAHDFLNGAFYSADQTSKLTFETWSTQGTVPETTGDTTEISTKIYNSELNNPFLFPVTQIVTIGVGRILALSSAAKALSQGQFGQFPLYAFTDEGVWALSVSDTGTFSARQPITRDVCTDPGAIAQIDSAVLFPTARGIMLIQGSDVSCITSAIDSDTPFGILDLPCVDELQRMMEIPADRLVDIAPFRHFLDGCIILYDYVNQRIIVANQKYDYAYVLSLRSHLWGMMYVDIRSKVNSYPEALAIDTGNNLVDFSAPDTAAATQSLIVTRLLKLDLPDTLKTISTVRLRGNFHKSNVAMALFGSRDLYSWHLVRSAKSHVMSGFRGTPYKYFRLAVLATLAPDESISSATVQFEPRYTNRLR